MILNGYKDLLGLRKIMFLKYEHSLQISFHKQDMNNFIQVYKLLHEKHDLEMKQTL